MQTRLKSNSAAILAAMFSADMTATEAAKACGINRNNFSPMLKADRPIHYKTAAKLRKTFGEDSITILPPAQA